MFYVYFLHSLSYPDQTYIGFTGNLKARFAVHNRAGDRHTAKYRPWKLMAYVVFPDEAGAKDFEKFCKSGTGRAMANKRFFRL